MRLFLGLLAVVALPFSASACEGECIVGITNAFIGNYTHPVHSVLEHVATQISDILPHQPSTTTSLRYLNPIVNAYRDQAYTGMQNAIFPSYFHGKCRIDGVEPDGCPNPDCPVVCGTPGSMVHFYGKLRYITFNQTRHILKSLSTPGTETYQQVEQAVLDAEDANTNTRRMSRVYARTLVNDTPAMPVSRARRSEDTRNQLKEIMKTIPTTLEKTCGGSGTGQTNGLPHCNWELEMKEYILTFP